MIFEPVSDGIIVKVNKSEFLEIVKEFIKEKQSEYKKFQEEAT